MSNELEIAFRSGFEKEAQKSDTTTISNLPFSSDPDVAFGSTDSSDTAAFDFYSEDSLTDTGAYARKGFGNMKEEFGGMGEISGEDLSNAEQATNQDMVGFDTSVDTGAFWDGMELSYEGEGPGFSMGSEVGMIEDNLSKQLK